MSEGQDGAQGLILPNDTGLVAKGQLDDTVSAPLQLEVLGLCLGKIPLCEQLRDTLAALVEGRRN